MKYTVLRNGVYYSQFTNPLTGKRIKKRLGKDRAEAKTILDALLSAYSLGSESPDGSANVLMAQKGCGWQIAYQSYYRTHISNYEGEWKNQLCLTLNKLNDSNNLNDVSEYEYKHIQNFIDDLKTKLKNATVNKYLTKISSFFDYCIKMKWIKENPCALVALLPESESDAYHFSDNDLKVLFDNANGFTDWWTFLLETGIRACDAKSFTKANFIVQDRMYVQFKQHKHGKKAKSIKLPLTKKAVKIVESAGDVIFPECYKWLNRPTKGHFNGFLEDSLKLMRGLLSDGNKFSMMKVEHHTFRHTFAINNLNAGMPKEVLQTLLGHASLKTTEKHYANWMSDVSLNKWVD